MSRHIPDDSPQVGDLFTSGDRFLHEWMNNTAFVVVDVNWRHQDPFLLLCQTNNKTVRVSHFTMKNYMKKA